MIKKTLYSLIFITLFIFPVASSAEVGRLNLLEKTGLWDIVLGISVYILTAVAFMKIAKKTNTEPVWLAWIPIANLYLISKIAREHWWPMLSLVVIIPAILIGLATGINEIIIVGILVAVFFGIVVITWEWKMFRRMGYPGWWVLSPLIPMVGQYVFIFLLMVVAWRSNPEPKTLESHEELDSKRIGTEE